MWVPSVEAWDTGFLALGRLLRQQGLLSAKGTTKGVAQEDSDSTQRRLAELCASIMQHVDLTLSDVATAMLLVSVAQDMRRRRVLREAMVAAAQAAGLSSLSRQSTSKGFADAAALQLAGPASAEREGAAAEEGLVRASCIGEAQPPSPAADDGADRARGAGLPTAVESGAATQTPPPLPLPLPEPFAQSGSQRTWAAGEPAASLPRSATPRPGPAASGSGPATPRGPEAAAAAAVSLAPVTPDGSVEDVRCDRSPESGSDDGGTARIVQPTARADLEAGRDGGSEQRPPPASRVAGGPGADGSGGVGSVKRAAAAIEAALAAGVTRSGSWSKAETAELTAAGAPAVGPADAATVAPPAAAAPGNDSDGEDDDPFCTFLPMPPAAASPPEVTANGSEGPEGEAKVTTRQTATVVTVVAKAWPFEGEAAEEEEELETVPAEVAAGAGGSEGGRAPTAQAVGAPPGLTAAAAAAGCLKGPGATQPDQSTAEQAPLPFMQHQQKKPAPTASLSPPQPFAWAQATAGGPPPLLQPAGSGDSLSDEEVPSLPSRPAAAIGMVKSAEPKTATGLAGTAALSRAAKSADMGQGLLPPSVSVLHNMLHLTPVGLEKHLQELAEEMEEEAEAQASISEAGSSKVEATVDATADGAEPEAAGGQGRAGAAPTLSSFPSRSAGSASLERKIARDVAATELRQQIADAALAAAFAAERGTVDRDTLEEARVFCRYAAAVYGDFDARTGGYVTAWQKRYGWRLRLGLMGMQDAMRAAIGECLEKLTPYVIHVNTENGAEGYLPYAVCLDEATRSVVISIRGTASLEDVVTDVLLAPYDVRDLLPPGLLPAKTSGGGGGAPEEEEEEPVLVHGGIWGAAEAVLVDLKRLGLLELLFPAPPGGAAASSSSAAPAASADSSAAAVPGKQSASDATGAAAAARARKSTGGGASASPERQVPPRPSVSGPSPGTGDRPPSLHRSQRSRWKTLSDQAPKLLSAERSVNSGGLLGSTPSRIVGDAGAKGWKALRSNMSRLVPASQAAGSGGGGCNLLLSQMSRLRAAAGGSSQTASASGAGGSVTGRSSSWAGLMTRLQSSNAKGAEAQNGGGSGEGGPVSARSGGWSALLSQLSRLQAVREEADVREEGLDKGGSSGSSEGRAGSRGWQTLRSKLPRLAPSEAFAESRTGGGGWRALLTQLPQLVAAQLTEACSLLGEITGGRDGTEQSAQLAAQAKKRGFLASRRASDKGIKFSTEAQETASGAPPTALPDGGARSGIKRLMITLPLPLPTRDGPAGASGGSARPWRVVVTGHSLGGGAAALLAMRLRAALPHVEVKAIVFAPPGALAGPELAAAMEPFCVSVVGGTDLVPRLSPQTMERYRDEMMTALARCSCSKAEVLIGSLTKTSRARRADRLLLPYEEIPPEAAEALWRYHRATQEVERLPELHAPGKILYLQPSAITVMQPPAAEPASAPGRTGSGDLGPSSPTTARRLARQTSSFLRRVPFFYGATPASQADQAQLRYRPVWVTAAELSAEGILASERMLADHNLTKTAIPALDQLLKPELRSADSSQSEAC
ncbi:hypothetical protein HYH03_002360 [Edaphochlamys debaryana]|uniref:sn-1-specific diacylglycerol lipase n=1 Tax=Edaphochlamys debaryana TaxID=47281 RepID=A0A836C5J0_9CHLO|nr:hypothetical protein HYH03_002360 [Edaphochlamys debaryana]|eukprot:KAG2500083.1 hypothetical protein HYH03_002360 [Edaphochlamys debaryana]